MPDRGEIGAAVARDRIIHRLGSSAIRGGILDCQQMRVSLGVRQSVQVN